MKKFNNKYSFKDFGLILATCVVIFVMILFYINFNANYDKGTVNANEVAESESNESTLEESEFPVFEEMDETITTDNFEYLFTRRGYNEFEENNIETGRYYWIVEAKNISNEPQMPMWDILLDFIPKFEDDKTIVETDLFYEHVEVTEIDGETMYQINEDFDQRTEFKPGTSDYFMVGTEYDLSEYEDQNVFLEFYDYENTIVIDSYNYE